MSDEIDRDEVERKYNTHLSGRDLRASSIGWEIALPIVAGPVIGYFIDQKFDKGVLFTLVLLGVGILIAVMNILRFINYEFSLIKSQEKEKEKENERKLD